MQASITLWQLLKARHMSPAFRDPSLQIEKENTRFIGFVPRKLGLSACGLRTWEIIVYLSWLNLWEKNDLTSFFSVSFNNYVWISLRAKPKLLRVVVLPILRHPQISYKPRISRSSVGGLIEHTHRPLMCTSKKYCSKYTKKRNRLT